MRCRVYLAPASGDSSFRWPTRSDPYAEIIIGGRAHNGVPIMERVFHELFEACSQQHRVTWRPQLGSGHGSDGVLFIMRHDQFTDIVRSVASTFVEIYDEVKQAWRKHSE